MQREPRNASKQATDSQYDHADLIHESEQHGQRNLDGNHGHCYTAVSLRHHRIGLKTHNVIDAPSKHKTESARWYLAFDAFG